MYSFRLNNTTIEVVDWNLSMSEVHFRLELSVLQNDLKTFMQSVAGTYVQYDGTDSTVKNMSLNTVYGYFKDQTHTLEMSFTSLDWGSFDEVKIELDVPKLHESYSMIPTKPVILIMTKDFK